MCIFGFLFFVFLVYLQIFFFQKLCSSLSLLCLWLISVTCPVRIICGQLGITTSPSKVSFALKRSQELHLLDSPLLYGPRLGRIDDRHPWAKVMESSLFSSQLQPELWKLQGEFWKPPAWALQVEMVSSGFSNHCSLKAFLGEKPPIKDLYS